MSCVYKYGLLRPTENVEFIFAQLRAAHNYRNALVEIEQERRGKLREALMGYRNIPALHRTALEAQEGARRAKAAVEEEKRLTGSTTVSAITEARQQRSYADAKEANAAFYLVERAFFADPATKSTIAEINECASERRRQVRNAKTTYWGTYQLVEAAAEQSAKEMPLYDDLEPNNPRFVRWTGEGLLSVQLQKGMANAEIFGEDRKVRVAPVDERAWASPVRGERRKFARTTLQLRVVSDEKKKPIWGVWPMIMHRPLPSGCRIKRATVSCRRIANTERWELHLTVEQGSIKRPPPGKGAVGIDLGWRARPDGSVRIASWFGDDGERAEVVLTPYMRESLTKPDGLRKTRDELLNDVRPKLAEALKACAATAELRERTRHLAYWRAAVRFSRLFGWWRKNRFEGDQAPFEILEAWWHRDRHLWQYECHQRDNAKLRRREFYRITARQLARHYHTAVVEFFNISDVATKSSTKNKKSRANRQKVAVSTFRAAVVHAFVEFAMVPAPGTTFLCHGCGSREHWDQAAEVEHTCSQCGEHWDQDYNAAVNILGLYKRGGTEVKLVHPDPLKPPAESRWAKAGRLKREREEKEKEANRDVA